MPRADRLLVFALAAFAAIAAVEFMPFPFAMRRVIDVLIIASTLATMLFLIRRGNLVKPVPRASQVVVGVLLVLAALATVFAIRAAG